MMTPVISIIIPVYNGEKYLKDCINSIEQQTFSNYEVIFVNDGSTDNSLTIIERAKSKDERIQSFSLPNGGVSKARNFGLSKAVGEWVTFVDCDDWIEKDYLNTLYSRVTDNVDVIMANFFFNKEKTQTEGLCSKKIIHKKDFPSYPLAMMVEDCAACDSLEISVEILCAACNKLTRRQLIINNGIKFEEKLKLNEDGLFHLASFLNSRDVIIIDKPLYHYRILSTSSNNRYRPNVHDQMLVWKKCFEKVICSLSLAEQDTFMSLSSYRMYLNLVSLYINHPSNKISFFQRKMLLSKFLDTDVYDVKNIPSSLKWFKKIEMFLLRKKCSLGLLLLSNIRFKLKKLCGII